MNKVLHYLIVYGIIILLAFSCKTQKNEVVDEEPITTVAESQNETIEEPEIEEPTLPVGESLVVSFYSIGSGINNEAMTSFNNYISGVGLTFKQIAWGREGEQDFCFSKSDLETIDYDKFISEIRSLLEDEEHVIIGENAKCKF